MKYWEALREEEARIVSDTIRHINQCTPLPEHGVQGSGDAESTVRLEADRLLAYLFCVAAAQTSESNDDEATVIMGLGQAEFRVSPEYLITTCKVFKDEVPAEAYLRNVYDVLGVKPGFEEHAILTLEISRRLEALLKLIKEWAARVLQSY